ncbi:MAG TPA: M20/M25/M40 family metallo-hydrolase, partial [Gemmatimonadaceae bacterium]|nr:M20/M25/M40 family metallo-hydrolase [Gemmatimonadaceae bacterium]
YASERGGQTDIFRYDLREKRTTQVTRTPESEYSPSVAPDGRSIAVVRVEADSAQRLWEIPLTGRQTPRVLLPEVKPVGYYAWADRNTLALFVLGDEGAPNTLQVARRGKARTDTILTGIGRSLHPVPGKHAVSFVHAAASPRVIIELDPATGSLRRLGTPLEGSDDFVWLDRSTLLMARGSEVYQMRVGDGGEWAKVADLAAPGIGAITRLAVSPRGDWLALVATPRAAAGASGAAAPGDTGAVREADVRRHLSVIADDSMMGRATGTPGIHKAARYIAEQFRALGLQPAGDSTGTEIAPYLQRVPARWTERNGQLRAAGLGTSWAAADTVPAARRFVDANVIGIIPGSDPALRNEAVLVTAHYDHVGVGAAVNGDSIYNGADDDGSGTVALLEIARQLKQGPAPKRTVVFAAVTGEERGLIGTRWYLDNPVVPLERTVANFNVEMIGRPDSLAGGPGKGWLTGYERSTMGDMLKAQGIPLVPDPRLDQDFFRRSDNYGFALRGIPAHTLSSFNLHADYHRPSDEVDQVDFAHMTEVIQAAARAVRLLADGEKVEWKPGGRP